MKKVIVLTEAGQLLADKLDTWDGYAIDYQDDQHIRLGKWNYSNDILCILAGHYDEVLWQLPLKDFIEQFCEEFVCNGDKKYIYKSLTYLEQRGLIHMKGR